MGKFIFHDLTPGAVSTTGAESGGPGPSPSVCPGARTQPSTERGHKAHISPWDGLCCSPVLPQWQCFLAIGTEEGGASVLHKLRVSLAGRQASLHRRLRSRLQLPCVSPCCPSMGPASRFQGDLWSTHLFSSELGHKPGLTTKQARTKILLSVGQRAHGWLRAAQVCSEEKGEF